MTSAENKQQQMWQKQLNDNTHLPSLGYYLLQHNPFATKADIDKKIRNELTASIDNAAKSDGAEGQIKCIFGSSLDDFKCSFHRLTG
jgi:hypothetical protein